MATATVTTEKVAVTTYVDKPTAVTLTMNEDEATALLLLVSSGYGVNYKSKHSKAMNGVYEAMAALHRSGKLRKPSGGSPFKQMAIWNDDEKPLDAWSEL